MFLKIINIVIFLALSSVSYAQSYLSSATCSSNTYHALKNELNMNISSTYSALKPYAAEAFVAYHIYSIDKKRDVGEEFQFGKNHIAKLLKYTDDADSGFEAGLYLIDNKRYIIAFGGTSSREKYSVNNALSSGVSDGLADAQLLSNRATSYQVNLAAIFLQSLQVDYPNKDITATGHSLGGGLAQFAGLMSKQYSKYKKIKAVTFNTAPMPLTNITKKWVESLNVNLLWADNNNINFMVNNDPLTNVLKSSENYTGNNLEKFEIDTGYPLLNKLLNDTKKGKKFKNIVFGIAQIYMNQTVRDLKKLIYGKRIILHTNTGHSMLSLIQKVSPDYANTGVFRHGFSDVKTASSGLYCDILKLMERHVISYPKKERAYNFEPNNKASIYETSIFIVNAFYYKEYREEERKNTNLTKYQYFLDYFNRTWDSNKEAPYHFTYLKNNFDKIYREQLKELDTSLSEKELDRCVQKSKDIVFWDEDKDKFTRGQLASWMVQSMNLNYTKIIKEVRSEIKEEETLKTGPNSLLKYEPPSKLDYMNTSNYILGIY